ncbi:MAG TPA: hypothetical protein VI356_07385 [Myxococcales bacterium]
MNRLLRLVRFLTFSFILCAAAFAARAANTSFAATYTGQGSGAASCGTTFSISGQEPSAAGTYPVFVYMAGTSETYTNAAATAAVTGMANRGYVAATVQYDSGSFGTCAQISGKAQCIFDASSATSAIRALCGRAKADCSKGIVVGGFSQGSIIAMLAKNYDGGVQAAYGMGAGVAYSTFDLRSCVANGNRSLTSDRLRAVDGELDQFLGGSQANVQSQLQELTGFTCAAGSYTCYQPNNSGWQIVKSSQVADGSADHCYMRASGNFCTGSQSKLDAGWQSGADTWELGANLDWLTGFTQH